jgi:L-iditol 2-dehydrogenase
MSDIPSKMRAAVTHGWNDMRVEEVPVPQPEAGEALVRVGACGICGTDLKILSGAYEGVWPPSLPFIQGHEWGGTVVALGEGVKNLKVGDRVTAENHSGCGDCIMCRRGRYNLCEVARTRDPAYKLYGHTAPGAFAEYATRPEKILHKIPDNLSFEASTIINQGSMGLHAVRRCQIEPGDWVAVFGPGLVGLIIVQLAKSVGATEVIAVGRGPRLEMAQELGADEIIDYTSPNVVGKIYELTEDRGVDCAYECAGSPAAVRGVIGAVRRGGRVGIVGLVVTEDVTLRTDRIVLDELDVYGVRSSPNAYPEFIRLIGAGKVNVEKLVSKVYPLEDINEAFEVFRKREGGVIRVVIKP